MHWDMRVSAHGHSVFVRASARTHAPTHTYTIMSLGKQGVEAVTRLCADLMSFNSLAAGLGAGQSWAEAKSRPDHLWRRKKSPGLQMKVCGRLCVMCMSFISLSPLIFSISVSLYLLVCSRCVRCLAGGSYRGQEQQWAEVRWTKPTTDTITPQLNICSTQSSYLLPNVQHINVLQNTHSPQWVHCSAN